MADFIGKGLKFPLEIDNTGKANLVSGEELINQSLTEIFSEMRTQRFMLGQFGSTHKKYQFMPIDDALESVLTTELYNASLQEKRVVFKEITFERISTNQINCNFVYVILRTNKTGTLVYPFFTEFTN
jgi:phage baseplate assembly protein W